MSTSERFRVNEPTVIQEVIDGEAIIADLGRGFYYSLDSLGSAVWQALVDGASVAEVIDGCAAHFAGDREEIAAGINALLAGLTAEQLLVARGDVPGSVVGLHGLLGAAGSAWTPPTLNKYTDMEQLLLLDPIHDVDETGWPNAPAAGA
jgi:hypothetical protein